MIFIIIKVATVQENKELGNSFFQTGKTGNVPKHFYTGNLPPTQRQF